MTCYSIEVTPADQHATLYRDGMPFATYQRRRVLDRSALNDWTVYATDGTKMFGCRTTAEIAEQLLRRMDRGMLPKGELKANISFMRFGRLVRQVTEA